MNPGSPLPRRYHAKGYARVRALFDAVEVHAWRDECDRLLAREELIDRHNLRSQWREHTTDGLVFDRFDPVTDISPVFDALRTERRIVRLAEEAVEAPVVPFKDKLIYKRPGLAGYGMHQDYPYWAALGPRARDFVNVLIAIDDAPRESGPIECYPGYQRRKLNAPGELDCREGAVDLARGEVLELHAGDVVVFHSLVPHRSAPNTTDAPRRSLFLTFLNAARSEALDRYEDHIRAYLTSQFPAAERDRLYFR